MVDVTEAELMNVQSGTVYKEILVIKEAVFDTSFKNRKDFLYVYAPNLLKVSVDQFRSAAPRFVFLP
jgi:hypothetical protein